MFRQATIRPLLAIVGGILLCSQSMLTIAVEPAKEATRPEPPPPAPTLSVAFTSDRLHLSWNAISEATYYQIDYASDGASHFSQIARLLTTTSYDHDIPVHQSNWSAARYRVEACNATGCATSNEVSALDAVLRSIGYFALSRTTPNEHPSVSVALSGDRSTLAVGDSSDSSAGIGIDDDQTSTPRTASSGAVHVFRRSGNTWSRQAYVKASNTSAGAFFGFAIALSNDGNTLAVGAYLEDSPGIGVNGNQGDIASNSSNAGAAYVFTRSDGNWSQQAYLKAFRPQANAYFGRSVAVSGDGNTVAVGATGENAGGLNSGAVYVYARSKDLWSQQAYVKALNIRTNAYFGFSVMLNDDGNTLAVAEHVESGRLTRIDRNPCDTMTDNTGPVYVFTRIASVWSERVPAKASTTPADEFFCSLVSSRGDANTPAAGIMVGVHSAAGISAE